MMSYDDFNKYILSIERVVRCQNDMWKLGSKYGVDFDFPDCVSELVNLLAYVMHDTDDMIEYFCYELDFGDGYHDGAILDAKGNIIKLQTVMDLYEYLSKG